MLQALCVFYTLTNLQGSQTERVASVFDISFTLLQTYKVLKLGIIKLILYTRFTLLQTYKVLKPVLQWSWYN